MIYKHFLFTGLASQCLQHKSDRYNNKQRDNDNIRPIIWFN